MSVSEHDSVNSGGTGSGSAPTRRPEYDTYDVKDPGASGYRVKVVRDFEDMAKVHVIRAAGTFDDPEYFYAKQFDGNDFSCTHLLGYIDGEPVGTIRIRYFADFTRIERLTIRPTYRKSRMAFKLARAALAWCRDKGYRKFSGVAREELVPFWSMLGFRLTEGKDPIFIYGMPHFDMTMLSDPVPNAITPATETMVMLRPEGRWHEAGYHETMNATKPSDAVPLPPMVRAARRPQDVAERMAGRGRRRARATPQGMPVGETGRPPSLSAGE